MVKIYGVKPHHGGFGCYQKDCEGVVYTDMESVDDYTTWVLGENTHIELVTEDDDDYAAVKAADGATYNQNGGEIVGWRDQDGNVTLECVEVS